MPELAARALSEGLDRLVRGGLRGVWLRGRPPSGPFVWAANHHSWWDPFVAAAVLRRLGQPACLLMRQDNLDQYAFARRLAVFGTGQLRRGLDHLAAGRVLVIYPEAELRPAGPPGPLAGGAAWFARRAGVPLCAVAPRVVLRGHQAPEAYLRLTAVPSGGDLAQVLQAGVADIDRLVATSDPRAPLPGFSRVLAGRRSWDERIDALHRRVPWLS